MNHATAKHEGRPSTVPIHVGLGESNPIEEKFVHAKTGCGLNHPVNPGCLTLFGD